MEVIHIQLKYLFDANCYLLHNENGFYLIDTGIKKQRKKLETAITEAGCQPGDLKLIILTHGHVDHVGNAAYLRDNYGAKIAMHQGDVNMVTGGGMFADAPQSLMIKIVGFFMNVTGLGDFETFQPDILLENQSLTEYGLDAEVIQTPGHSKGSISLQTNGTLFCGDIFNGSMENITTLVNDQTALDYSAEKLRNIQAETVYPGHGKPFPKNSP
ncbi:MAG: MBL fold metallo-hydrolase [Candidatus Bathyarchaeota archaeon]|nr:MBL fold metallo-hydrolase [Candidatus Bathyarchaeota archaeon]